MKRRRQAVIKGSSLPVLRVVVRDGDAASLRAELLETIENARPMLAEAIAVLDLREREAGNVDLREIVQVVRDGGVRLAAVLIGEPNARETLADLDLPVIEAPLPARDRPGGGSGEPPPMADARAEAPREQVVEAATAAAGPRERPATTSGAQAAVAVAQTSSRTTPQPPTDAPPYPQAQSGLAPLYLTRPLRSGQRIYAQGRDAVVTAPTSRGSELIADGSIYAFSPIRGRVLAGASGDTGACIVASHLDAELVAVAGVYRTFEPDDLKAHGSGPLRVTLWLDADGNERLTLEALAPSSSMQRK